MKKDTMYSLRLNSMIREALKKAAEMECRTMASMLDKIITDFLKKKGLLSRPEHDVERRRFPRKNISLPSRAISKSGEKIDSIPSVVRDISLGGFRVILPKNAEVRITQSTIISNFELLVEFPEDDQLLTFACDTRRIDMIDSEIQIGASFANMNSDEIQKLRRYLN